MTIDFKHKFFREQSGETQVSSNITLPSPTLKHSRRSLNVKEEYPRRCKVLSQKRVKKINNQNVTMNCIWKV